MVGRYAGAEAEAAHGRRLGERTLGFDPGRRLPLADGLPTSSVAAIQAEHRVAHQLWTSFTPCPVVRSYHCRFSCSVASPKSASSTACARQGPWQIAATDRAGIPRSRPCAHQLGHLSVVRAGASP